MRVAVLLGMFSIIGLGCSTTSHPHAHEPRRARSSDVTGYWEMPPTFTTPDKPGDPQRQVDLRGWIIFSADGTYRSSTTLNGDTTEESGKWRMSQPFLTYVYLRPNGRDHEGQFILDARMGFEDLTYLCIDEPRYAPINLGYTRSGRAAILAN